ncbi:hypothetical protein, partial [Roseibacillus ishigakijimensis]
MGKQRKNRRLIAIRATPEVINKRRRERRKTAKQNGKIACSKAL